MSLGLRSGQLVGIKRQQTSFLDHPVKEWIGAENTTDATSTTTVTSRSIIASNGTLQSIGLEIKSGSPTVGRVYATVILENAEQGFKTTLCRGYVYPGHLPWGAGGIGVKFGDNIRVETRSSIADVVLRPRATILQNVYQIGGWTGTDKGSTEGPGRVRLVTTADPTTGNDIDQQVPAGRRWKVYDGVIPFTTDANAGTRSIPMELTDDNDDVFWSGDPWGTITATSTLHTIYFKATSNNDQSGAKRQGEFQTVTLESGWHIKTTAASLQAGDDFGAAFIRVEEWISP